MPAAAPNRSPTQQLCHLVQSLERRFTQMGAPSQATLDRIALLLEVGANPHGSSSSKGTLLDQLSHVPAAALLLMEKGACVSQDGLVAIHAACMDINVHLNKDTLTQRDNQARLRSLVDRQPGLEWYAEMGDHLHPCVFDLETCTPGINEALEVSQAKAGLPVGRDIPDRERRLAAIIHLKDPYNPYIWMGSDNRVELLDRLMRDDITANDELFWADGTEHGLRSSMLVHFMGENNDICRALFERGAVLGEKEMIIFLDCIEYSPSRPHMIDLIPDVMARQDQWKDLTHPVFGNMFKAMIEFAGQEFAEWQADHLNNSTPSTSRKPSSLRL